MNEDEEQYYDYAGVAECPNCGGAMEWCELCQMWTQTCCEEYGSCMCS